jgi:hypothetical protein
MGSVIAINRNSNTGAPEMISPALPVTRPMIFAVNCNQTAGKGKARADDPQARARKNLYLPNIARSSASFAGPSFHEASWLAGAWARASVARRPGSIGRAAKAESRDRRLMSVDWFSIGGPSRKLSRGISCRRGGCPSSSARDPSQTLRWSVVRRTKFGSDQR